MLVAAATDHTGRTINLLTAGLVGVAVGLVILTVWYWRDTSPRNRTESVPPSTELTSILDGDRLSSPDTDDLRSAAVTTAVSRPATGESETALDLDNETGRELPADDFGTSVETTRERPLDTQGIEEDQWALVTQAVFDSYLDGDDGERDEAEASPVDHRS